MTIEPGKKYVLQNVFTRNVITQLPGGAGPAGLCGWVHPWVPEEGTREWTFREVTPSLYGIWNVQFPEFRIYGTKAAHNAPGHLGSTSGGPHNNQQWKLEPVEPDSDVYTIKNHAGNGYALDSNSHVVGNSLLRTYQTIDPYNPTQYHWKLIKLAS